MPRLLVKKRAEILTEYVVKKTKVKVLIGSRKGNDIVIVDRNISEQHCVITFENGQYSLKDQNTITGTQINGRTITEAPLNFGDEISVGSYNILFLDEMSLNKKDELIPQYYLVGIYGKFYGKKYILRQEGDTFIGRENLSPRGIENDVVLLGDMTTSKGHAKITCIDNKYTITDIGSTGGVAVNGIKVGQLNSMSLQPGDEISIGRTIFRLVDYYSENYSMPVNQKIFILKILRLLLLFISIAIVLSSAVLIGIGYNGISLLNSKADKIDLSINSQWMKDTPVRADSSNYTISSTPVIADFNGDGINDIAMLTGAGFLYAWNGKTGDALWKQIEIYNSGIASLAASDINNDGIPDIIALSDSSLIYIIDGQTGGIIRREILGGVISEMTPVVCDLDSDGRKDIVVASEDGTLHFLYSAGFDSKYAKYSEFIDGPIYASPIILSRKDFSPFVVVANYDSKVYFIDGKSRIKKTVNLLELTGKAHLIAGSPSIGDINDDGIDEIIVQTNVPQYVSAIDTTKFSVIWTYFVEPTPSAGLKFNSSPIVSDFTGNGIKDVMIVSANATVQLLKGNTTYPSGELLWKLNIPEGKRIISSPSAYDFDKDGLLDIVFGTEDGRILIAKSNAKRKEIELIADIKASNVPITSTPLIADVNGDKTINIIYTNVIDSIQVIDSNAKTIKNLLIWPMFLANAEHTSTMSVQHYKMQYMKMIFLGCVLILLFIVTKVRKIISKSKKRVKVIYL